ncbi:hypothetical protein [Colwellia sp. MEBiC06753]
MKSVIGSLLLFLVAPIASANLLVNGSFDETGSPLEFKSIANAHNLGPDTERYLDTLDETKNWGIFTGIPGWQVVQGSYIEVLHTGANTDGLEEGATGATGDVKAHSEGLFVELDLDEELNNQTGKVNAAIGQTLLNLMVGELYEIVFYYQPRTTLEDDNGIALSWFDGGLDNYPPTETVLTVDGQADSWKSRDDLDDNGWARFSAEVEATSATMSIAFTGLGGVNGRGGFIDTVSVTKAAVPVPVPATSILLLTLIPLMLRKRR